MIKSNHHRIWFTVDVRQTFMTMLGCVHELLVDMTEPSEVGTQPQTISVYNTGGRGTCSRDNDMGRGFAD